MKIKVYAGNDTASEKIAEFYDESVFEECMEILENWATANGWSFTTEDIEEEDES